MWRHVRVLLKPVNPAFETIEITAENDSAVSAVAELIEMLGSAHSQAAVG